MLDLLKLYPNKTSFFIGTAIGLGTYIVSTSLCVFAAGCPNGNPFFPLATLLGSLTVGMYCGWLVRGRLKFIVAAVVTLLTMFAALWSGIRGIIDSWLGNESFLSHSLLYGFVTLILAFAISLLDSSGNQIQEK